MRDVAVIRIGVFTVLALLVGCGGATTATRPAPAPLPKAEPAPPPPIEPSEFEQRWSSACDAQGAVGECPAPFDRPAVFVDVGEGEHTAPPFCGALDVQDGAAARDALTAKRKALKACFRGAAPGTFVELGPKGIVVTDPSRVSAARTETCVAKLVTRTLTSAHAAQPERLIVLLSTPAKPSDPALSKTSLDAVINAHASEVSACYDSALAVWPGLKGRIASAIVIWFDGRVALVHTGESTLDNPMLECCINTTIRSWPFPKPSDGSIALVSFPFTLGPRSEAP